MAEPKLLFEATEELEARLAGKEPAIFLDYDGTLTPIVNDPAAAKMSDEMRSVVHKLAQRYTVALVSGRDLKVLKNFVQLDGIYYAGSHGFDIQGPDEMQKQNELGIQCQSVLDQAEHELTAGLSGIKGCEIERKGFAIAVHYRNVAPKDASQVEKIVNEVVSRHEKLRRGEGKMVFELQPDVDWHKGKAVLWLLDVLKLNREDVVPIYMGDDVTDEDAFGALPQHGLGIYVGSLERPTKATFYVRNVDQVKQFLEMLAN